MKRYTRIHKLSDADKKKLKQISDETSGMTMYGNRARVAVMLHLKNAELIAALSKISNKTANEIINIIIDTFINHDNNKKGE